MINHSEFHIVLGKKMSSSQTLALLGALFIIIHSAFGMHASHFVITVGVLIKKKNGMNASHLFFVGLSCDSCDDSCREKCGQTCDGLKSVSEYDCTILYTPHYSAYGQYSYTTKPSATCNCSITGSKLYYLIGGLSAALVITIIAFVLLFLYKKRQRKRAAEQQGYQLTDNNNVTPSQPEPPAQQLAYMPQFLAQQSYPPQYFQQPYYPAQFVPQQAYPQLPGYPMAMAWPQAPQGQHQPGAPEPEIPQQQQQQQPAVPKQTDLIVVDDSVSKTTATN
jgi:hypothetical protein